MAANSYVTITSGLRGYFAVLVVDDEPWQTGIGSYAKAEDAVPEAKSWAEAEGIPYRGPGGHDPGRNPTAGNAGAHAGAPSKRRN